MDLGQGGVAEEFLVGIDPGMDGGEHFVESGGRGAGGGELDDVAGGGEGGEEDAGGEKFVDD